MSHTFRKRERRSTKSNHAYAVLALCSSFAASLPCISCGTSTPMIPTTQQESVLIVPPPTTSIEPISSGHSSSLYTSNVLAAATLAPPVATTTSSPVGPAVFIADINYNGNVPTTEADEYVVLTNGKTVPADVSGYFVYVATNGSQGSTFYFPKDTVIKPNGSVRVYTNEIHKETGGYSFGSGRALWNNRGGLAVLKDSNGKKIGEFKYQPAAAAAKGGTS